MSEETDAERAERKFWEIRNEVKGHPMKALMRLPAAMRALRNLAAATFKAR